VLGKGTLGIRVADWFLRSPDHEIAWIVPVVPEPTWTESLAEWAKQHELPVVDSGDYRAIPDVGSPDWGCDLGISVFYDKIIKADFIGKCGRLLNIHNSPLPRYRGVSPINWALKNEEDEHGVTIHEITPGIDDGPIVAQVKYSIFPHFDEVEDVYQRALRFAWTLFEQTMPVLDRIEARPQHEEAVTYYSRDDDARLGDRRGFRRDQR
jgi:methionyl-tRNA formyltransferase